MSHFYGTLDGQAGQATRRGSKKSGLKVVAASYKGAIVTELKVDDKGRDCFTIYQASWQGVGHKAVVAEGFVGEPLAGTSTKLEGHNKSMLSEKHSSTSKKSMLLVLKALHGCHRAFSSSEDWGLLDDEARAEAEKLIELLEANS